MRISDWSSDVCSSDLLARSLDILESQKGEIGFNRIISDTKVAKISVVGVGMKSHAGIAAGMFKSLADRGINILAISTSEIKVSVLTVRAERGLAFAGLQRAMGFAPESPLLEMQKEVFISHRSGRGRVG